MTIATAPSRSAAPPANYEAALAELETLVAAMEGGQLPLPGGGLLEGWLRRAHRAAPVLPCPARSRRAAGGEGARGRGSSRPGRRGRNEAGRFRHLVDRRARGRRSGARCLGAARRARRTGRGDALRGARRRQAPAAAPGAGGGQGGPRQPRGGDALGLRGRADPRLFAGPRRPALHGQRRSFAVAWPTVHFVQFGRQSPRRCSRAMRCRRWRSRSSRRPPKGSRRPCRRGSAARLARAAAVPVMAGGQATISPASAFRSTISVTNRCGTAHICCAAGASVPMGYSLQARLRPRQAPSR